MWFWGEKVMVDHKMLWFEDDFWAKNERKNARF
jgi:hypothetical protein